jgi:3-dehydroquinate synthase
MPDGKVLYDGSMTTIRVNVPEAYEVIVGRGLLGRLPALLAGRCAASRYAVIADAHVADLHGASLMEALKEAGLEARLFTFPAGEWNKNREHWARLTDELLAWGLGRDGAIIAFGGGVAGDLGGFVAATYLRGVPFVQLPTSLLAMIDASVGGKTGVDVPAGKNLVGAFHQPRFVLADIDLLATLPRTHIAAGMAEAIKHGAIIDAPYFDSLADATACLAKDGAALEDVVRQSVAIKARIVAADEKEGGLRQVLNFGHTVGHAVEALSGFGLLHGEAVAIGMAVEAGIAEASGVAEPGTRKALVAMLERYALPVEIPEGLSSHRLLELMRADKKVRAGRVRLALPKKIGLMVQSDDGAWTVEVEERLLREAISL